MLQHGAYTLIMDSIYDREKFPTIEEAIDWVWASNQDEIDAITFVLNKFFTLEDGVYMQHRMADELQEYVGKCLTNGINGKKGGRPKGSKNKPKETQSVNNKTQSVNLESESEANESDLKPNHKPITNNHKPITNINTKTIGSTEKSDLKKAISDNFDLFYSAYPKKASKPEAKAKFVLYCKGCKTTQEVWHKTEFLMLDVQNRLEQQHWLTDKINKVYIPNPARYLLRELWNDEIVPKNTSPAVVDQDDFVDRHTDMSWRDGL